MDEIEAFLPGQEMRQMMKPVERFTARSTAVLGVLMLTLAGCGGAGESTGVAAAPAAAEQAPATVAPAIDVERCGGFGVEAAAEILGVPAAELEDRSRKELWGMECSFIGKGEQGAEREVSFMLNREESVEAAKLYFQSGREAAGIGASMKLAGEATEVLGLGDEALWSPEGGLDVRMGAVRLVVREPKEKAQQIAVAKRLIEVRP